MAASEPRAGLRRDLSGHHQQILRIGIAGHRIAARKHQGGLGERDPAGGAESMSLVPMGGNKVAPNPASRRYPDVYLTTGSSPRITRAFTTHARRADAFACEHQRAGRRWKPGCSETNDRYRCVRLGRRTAARNLDGCAREVTSCLSRHRHRDAGTRLRRATGSRVLVSQSIARERQLKPLARFVATQRQGSRRRFGTGPGRRFERS